MRKTKKKIRIKELLVDYFKELLGFMRELTKNQLFIGWLFEATLNQQPPTHHPLDVHNYSIVDEPQLS
jgi:hypothetical protein